MVNFMCKMNFNRRHITRSARLISLELEENRRMLDSETCGCIIARH
jgi:hypothetical protein